MHGRLMLAAAVALCVSAWVLAAPDGDSERPGRGERGRGGEKGAQSDRDPSAGRGPGRPASRPEWGEGGFGRGGPMHRGGYRRKPLTKDEEAELLKHLEKEKPDLHKQLKDLCKRDEDGYRRMLLRYWGVYDYLRKLPKEIRIAVQTQEKARHEAYRLVKAIEQTKDAAYKARLKVKLREAVAAHFKAEQIVREYRLARLIKEIERTLAEIKGRSAKQTEEIINSRVEAWLKGFGRYPPRRDRGRGSGSGPGGPKPPPGKGRRPADGGPKPKE